MTKPPSYRFAFDIGGTFTDLVLLGSDGSMHSAKLLSDPINIVAPIAKGLLQLCDQHGIAIGSIHELVVGATTAVTNLVIERKGAKTALITTQGFRDVIAIGRELRYDIYNLTAPGPDPIVDRSMRLEIDERSDASGAVLKAPSKQAIDLVIDQAMAQAAESIAVCLLHSFSNPSHERMIRDQVLARFPSIPVSLSHEVLGELREYERTVATVLNAYVAPKVGDYLGLIERGLRAIGIHADLRVMQSNGGVISKSFGERFPIRLLESGPAAGALGAAHTALELGIDQLIAFDMGGTTAKACLMTQGEPGITTEFEAARSQRFKKGSGLPVRIPTVDLIEIGAGGGSIAHIDATGLLKVGPHSAGSNPGPACYGLGGMLPTVTDAAVLLGYLDPAANLSDAVQLRYDLAAQAMRESVAVKLGLSLDEAAAGVHRIVCEQMAAAAKVHAVEKAKDIRRCTLLAFGGAGPLHAREVARRIGCKQILVPSGAGVFSAFGLLVAPLKLDLVQTRYQKLLDLDLEAAEDELQAMQARLGQELDLAGAQTLSAATQASASHGAYRFVRSADMRYVGQGFELVTALAPDLRAGSHESLRSSFETAYQQRFGSPIHEAEVEILNWRIEAYASEGSITITSSHRPPAGPSPALRSRRAYFPCIRNWIDTPVFADADLIPERLEQGPALIEQAGSTLVIGPGDHYRKDRNGNIHINVCPSASGKRPETDGSADHKERR
ncbi:MAG: hydantoinase/oxoprolinase family protein [Betaproteobacteria bacterium]|nr:hydantoinase/oxoprolinase family protein [Betaproteobacteria bacterium]